MIDTESEAITIYGVYRLRPIRDEPITTGSIGSMHGASTVSDPAKNAISNNVMSDYCTLATTVARVGEPDHFWMRLPLASTCTNVCWVVTPYFCLRAVALS